MEIVIPVKPHIRKFYIKKSKQSEPIKIDSNSYLGDVFTSLGLASVRSKKLFYKEKEYSSQLVFELNQELDRKLFPTQEILDLNIRLNKIFLESMYDWAMSAVMLRSSASKGIRSFLSYYKIEEDYSWETAYRAWMRYYHSEYEREKQLVS